MKGMSVIVIVIENCPICLDTLSNNKEYKSKCNHVFHKKCIFQYSNHMRSMNIRCPLCNAEIILDPPIIKKIMNRLKKRYSNKIMCNFIMRLFCIFVLLIVIYYIIHEKT